MWFCSVMDGYGSKTVATAGEVEYFVNDMLDEGYELSDIWIFNTSDRQALTPISKPSFEFRPGVKKL